MKVCNLFFPSQDNISLTSTVYRSKSGGQAEKVMLQTFFVSKLEEWVHVTDGYSATKKWIMQSADSKIQNVA